MRTARKNALFTLIEMMIALALFAGIMALLMQYFSTAQRLWISTASKSEMFENARVAMDLIENDLMCAYYSYGHTSQKLFFYPVGNSKQLGFASMRSAPPNSSSSSSLCEIQYKLLLGQASAKLMINVMGDYLADGTANGYWDITSYESDVSSTANPFTTYDDSVYDTTSPSSNLDGWCEVIPYVIDFSFLLYDKTGNAIAGSTGADFIAQSDKMPYTVSFTLTMVDRDSFAKYFSLHPSANLSSSTDYSAFLSDPLISNSKRKFTRQVTIERGQYD